MTSSARTPRTRERGVSVVEYALLIAVLAVASLAGIDALKSSASATFRAEAAELSDGPSVAPPTSATPTTVAPTTTAAPTTTTTTTTTTTSTTTTTIPRATTALASWGAASGTLDGKRWDSTATLTVTDDRGQPVRGADVTVLVEYRSTDGRWRDADEVDGTTSSTGAVRVSSEDLNRTGKSAVTAIRYSVVDVDADRLDWNGDRASVTVSAP